MRFRAAVAAICAASLVLSACGGDDGDDVASEADDTVEETTPDTEDESSDDTDDESTDDTEPADDGEDGSDDDGDTGDLGDIEDLGDAMDLLNSDCLEFSLAYASIFMAGLGLMGGDDAALEDAMADLEELNASVPDEIADEFEVVAEAYSGYWEEIAGLSLMELGDVPNPDDEDEVREAQEAIDAYLEEECATG